MISPLLFNLVTDALAAMIDRAREAGHIHGMATRIIPEGVNSLAICGWHIILIQYSEVDITNLKFLLMCFEAIVGAENKLR